MKFGVNAHIEKDYGYIDFWDDMIKPTEMPDGPRYEGWGG